jgi:hypothetical protein
VKDLIDLKKIWAWCVERWRTSFGCVVLAIVAFSLGIAWESKQITEDCRFMGSFRDGAQAYNCQPRVR